MNKKRNYLKIGLILFSINTILFLDSCATQQSNVMSFILSDGRLQYYVTPVIIKSKEVSCSVDFTIHCNNTTISDDVVMNYTIDDSILNTKDSSTVKVSFAINDKIVRLQNENIIYRNVKPKKIRMNSTINKEEFKNMIDTEETVYILFTTEEENAVKLNSKELNSKLKELRSVIY